jgi:hypothetical protein
MIEPQKPYEPQVRKPRSFLFQLLKWTLIVLVLLVVAFVGVGLFVLDGKYDVSREITIKAKPEAIHAHVGDLNKWPAWLPFVKEDPSVKTTVVKPSGADAHQHWTSDHGNGELTFTASDEQKGIEYWMLFDKKWKSNGSFTYAKSGDDTRVTWRMTGQNDDFLGKWMAAAMPAMVGPQFEKGLADLKAEVEKSNPGK